MKLIDDWWKTLRGSAAVWWAVAAFMLGLIGAVMLIHAQFVYDEPVALGFTLAGVVCTGIVPLARVIWQKGSAPKAKKGLPG